MASVAILISASTQIQIQTQVLQELILSQRLLRRKTEQRPRTDVRRKGTRCDTEPALTVGHLLFW